MNYLNPHWLAQKFEHYTDDDLHDRHREICAFGGADTLKSMIEMESKRREAAYANSRGIQMVSEAASAQ